MRFFAIAALVLVATPLVLAASVPTLPQSFSVVETDQIDIKQGDFSKGTGGAFCCSGTAQDCQIQVESDAGNLYQDGVNQRTRFYVLGTDQSLYTDFKAGKQYVVQNNTCQSYCPLDETWGAFGPDGNSTLISASTPCPDGSGGYDANTECQHWQFKVKIFGVITMEIDNWYLTVGENPLPVAMEADLTPFGQPIGSEASFWQNFVPGMPDASKFDVQGLSSCQEGQNCNSNSAQIQRLRWNLHETYVRVAQRNALKDRDL